MTTMSEKTPLIASGIIPPSDASGDKPTAYFLERQKSISSAHAQDAEEIETLPEGSVVADFEPRAVSVTSESNPSAAGKKGGGKPSRGGWLRFFPNVGRKAHAFASANGAAGSSSVAQFPRSAPVKIDPKVFFANERTFLAWMHVSVILAGASVVIVAFADNPSTAHHRNLADQLYGVILLPVSIAFILYAMMQYSRRASMIRRKAPGPYVDIVGPTVLTVILMLSIVAQFSVKLYTLM